VLNERTETELNTVTRTSKLDYFKSNKESEGQIHNKRF